MRSFVLSLGVCIAVSSLSVLAQRTGTTRGVIFFGCYDSYPTGATQFGTSTSAAACAASCESTGTNGLFAFYSPSTRDCRCGTQYNQPNVLRSGNAGRCATTSNYEYYRTSTTFTTYGASACRTTAQITGATYASANGVRSCHVRCASNVYAYYWDDGANGWKCACSNDPLTSSTAAATCASGNVFVFTHSVQSQGSALDRRRKVQIQKKREADAIRYRFCPRGFTACHVSENGDGYECIDTRSDIDSCGGCLYGYYGSGSANATDLPVGQDCGTFGASLGGYTCEDGHCRVLACERGKRLVDGVCVR